MTSLTEYSCLRPGTRQPPRIVSAESPQEAAEQMAEAYPSDTEFDVQVGAATLRYARTPDGIQLKVATSDGFGIAQIKMSYDDVQRAIKDQQASAEMIAACKGYAPTDPSWEVLPMPEATQRGFAEWMRKHPSVALDDLVGAEPPELRAKRERWYAEVVNMQGRHQDWNALAFIETLIPRITVRALETAGMWRVYVDDRTDDDISVSAVTEESARRCGARVLAKRLRPELFELRPGDCVRFARKLKVDSKGRRSGWNDGLNDLLGWTGVVIQVTTDAERDPQDGMNVEVGLTQTDALTHDDVRATIRYLWLSSEMLDQLPPVATMRVLKGTPELLKLLGLPLPEPSIESRSLEAVMMLPKQQGETMEHRMQRFGTWWRQGLATVAESEVAPVIDVDTATTTITLNAAEVRDLKRWLKVRADIERIMSGWAAKKGPLETVLAKLNAPPPKPSDFSIEQGLVAFFASGTFEDSACSYLRLGISGKTFEEENDEVEGGIEIIEDFTLHCDGEHHDGYSTLETFAEAFPKVAATLADWKADRLLPVQVVIDLARAASSKQ